MIVLTKEGKIVKPICVGRRPVSAFNETQDRRPLPFYQFKTIVPAVLKGDDYADALGFGYVDEKTGRMATWGTVFPQDLIRSWRAMRLFQTLPVVGERALCACWHSVQDQVNPHKRHLLKLLSAAFDRNPRTYGAFAKIRRKTIKMLPSEEDLSFMLDRAVGGNAFLIASGLTPYVENGLLPALPQYKELQAREKAWMAAAKADRAVS